MKLVETIVMTNVSLKQLHCCACNWILKAFFDCYLENRKQRHLRTANIFKKLRLHMLKQILCQFAASLGYFFSLSLDADCFLFISLNSKMPKPTTSISKFMFEISMFSSRDYQNNTSALEWDFYKQSLLSNFEQIHRPSKIRCSKETHDNSCTTIRFETSILACNDIMRF